jgi:hypothetical protein
MESSESLQTACRTGDLPLLKRILSESRSQINEKDQNLGWTGLYRSVICGHYEATEYLLKQGADPNIKTRMGDTALHQATDNKQYKLAELLILYNADVNSQQNDGETPLHLACFKGDHEMVNILLFHKANPNLKNLTFGKTPLHYAVDYCYNEIIAMLVSNKASVEIPDKHGKTAKDIARTSEILGLLVGEESEKHSMGAVSPILSRSNSDFSVYSDCKSVEFQVKQLEDIHKKIREKVRASFEQGKVQTLSRDTSSLFEPDAEKTGFELFVDKNKIISFGGTERNPELHNFLLKFRLDELFCPLICAGYDDLDQLTFQMTTSMPITEQSLKEIGIHKQGMRKRLLLALDLQLNKENQMRSPKKGFNCCAVSVPNNFWLGSLPSVDIWLESLNLKSCFKNFCEAGYDDLEDMLMIMNSCWEITNTDLIEIGIEKPGYRHRILAKLKEDCLGQSSMKREVLFERNSNIVACESCHIF